MSEHEASTMTETNHNRTTRPPLSAVPSLTAPAATGRTAQRSHAAATTAYQSAAAHRKGAQGAGQGSHGGKPRRVHPALVALIAVAVIALVAYAGGVVAFSNVFYPNTEIAGVDVSLMTAKTAAARVESSAVNYKLTIKGNDFTWEYKPEDSSTLVDASARADEILQENAPFSWPFRLARALSDTKGVVSTGTAASGSEADRAVEAAKSIELPSSFNFDDFTQRLAAACEEYNQGRSGAFDAASAFDADQGKFTLEKVKANVKIDTEKVTAAAKVALADLDTSIELDSSFFDSLAANATDEQLTQAIDAANKLVAHTITLTMAGSAVATLDPATLEQWVTFGDDLSANFDMDAMTAWLRQLTIDSLDTVGTERTYTRPNGKVVTVSGGTYGWEVSSAELAKQVQSAVQTDGDQAIEVATTSKADTFTKRGERDWGAFIDVDLTEQHAYLYDASGNLLWESGIISGNPNKGDDTATPTGVYRMLQPSRDTTLVGKKDESGKPSYQTKVSYWMPFVGSAIGLHDASWQASASFSNPSAYLSVGSHGCVNLPPAKAAELYDKVASGLCVVVHW